MPIYKGTTPVKRVYKGTTEVTDAYLGTTKKHEHLTCRIAFLSDTETSVTYRIYNDFHYTVTAYYEINDATPDAYSVSISANSYVDRTISGLTGGTYYTFYARLYVDGIYSPAVSHYQQTDVPAPSGTARPDIWDYRCEDNGFGKYMYWKVKNLEPSGTYATIWSECQDSTPDISRGSINGQASTSDLSWGSFTLSSVTIYAKAQVTGRTVSTTDSQLVNTSFCFSM